LRCFYRKKLNKWFKKIAGYFLFTLFLGYYGSITLFTHVHHIENGLVIVHSHPFRQGTEKNPVNHQHTSEGYVLIHFLDTFLKTFLAVALFWAVIKRYFRALKFSGAVLITPLQSLISPHGLRAPPHSQI
jgi:hypothetical protein